MAWAICSTGINAPGTPAYSLSTSSSRSRSSASEGSTQAQAFVSDSVISCPTLRCLALGDAIGGVMRASLRYRGQSHRHPEDRGRPCRFRFSRTCPSTRAIHQRAECRSRRSFHRYHVPWRKTRLGTRRGRHWLRPWQAKSDFFLSSCGNSWSGPRISATWPRRGRLAVVRPLICKPMAGKRLWRSDKAPDACGTLVAIGGRPR